MDSRVETGTAYQEQAQQVTMVRATFKEKRTNN